MLSAFAKTFRSAPDCEWQAVGLSRQCRLFASPGDGDRAGAQYIEQEHSNIHRGVHYLSMKATTAYEGAREKVKRFINARESKECIFVKGATEGINLVMNGYGRKFVVAGDEVIISAMEHHSNIVPWQMLCEEKNAKLRVIPMNDAGELLMDEYDALLNERTRLVAVTHVSNSLGTINPIKEIVERAHKYVRAGFDRRRRPLRTCWSMYRIWTAISMRCPATRCLRPPHGVVYGKAAWLEQMNPFQGGGDMIKSRHIREDDLCRSPKQILKPHACDCIANRLGAAIDYLSIIGREKAAAYEHELLVYATERISAIEGVRHHRHRA